jgi:hypothetical protein
VIEVTRAAGDRHAPACLTRTGRCGMAGLQVTVAIRAASPRPGRTTAPAGWQRRRSPPRPALAERLLANQFRATAHPCSSHVRRQRLPRSAIWPTWTKRTGRGPCGISLVVSTFVNHAARTFDVGVDLHQLAQTVAAPAWLMRGGQPVAAIDPQTVGHHPLPQRLDDATSRLMQLRFVASESAFDYFRATGDYLRRTSRHRRGAEEVGAQAKWGGRE